jgi:antitoxin PrlF
MQRVSNSAARLAAQDKVRTMRAYLIKQKSMPTAPMEATVAERGQITLPKSVRDALGLTKGTKLTVAVEGASIVMRKDVDDALSRLRGRFKLSAGATTDDVVRRLRGYATDSQASIPGRPKRSLK